MTELPESFKERMKRQLGGEYTSFLACFGEEGYSGVRVNTGRISPEAFRERFLYAKEAIPWTGNGFYTEKSEQISRHPYYYAGLYYIQEPSAMLPASRLPVAPGDVVLDLCAAPGGKATELASRLGGTGLLVANDVSASRAKALLKNLTVWGCTNCCITGETPEKLLASFGCFFDKILVDAPCSGEGMFRKDSGLIESWKQRGPEAYALLQRQILDCAVQMLKPDGMLLYSTCTFAEEEDEQVIGWILERHPELELMEAERAPGLSDGLPPCEKALRAWPHRVKGEGHFLALLHKKAANGEAKGEAVRSLRGGRRSDPMPAEVKSFLEQLPRRFLENRQYRQIGEQCLLLPAAPVLPEGLRYLRTGLLAGTYKKGRFEPSQALAMALDASSYPAVVNFALEDERVIRYLKGETIELDNGRRMAKGWVLICVDGFALGWGKASGTSIKNKYYPGWRMQ